jgi:hypothetical protein
VCACMHVCVCATPRGYNATDAAVDASQCARSILRGSIVAASGACVRCHMVTTGTVAGGPQSPV